MMTHDEISRFFSEEEVKKAFQFPDWPAGTEVVLEHAEYMYDLLTKAIEEYGDEVKLQYISFTSPVENISFGMTQMPPLPVKTLAKHIGASIKKMKRVLRDWDNELKGIVEFDD